MKLFAKKSSSEIEGEIAELKKELATVSGSIEAILTGNETPSAAGDKIVKLRAKAEVLAARIKLREADQTTAKIREARQAYAAANDDYTKSVAVYEKNKKEFFEGLMKTHDNLTARRHMKNRILWPDKMKQLRIDRRAALHKLQVMSEGLKRLGVFDAAIPADTEDEDPGQAVA